MENDFREVFVADAAKLAGTRAVDAQGRLLVLRHATNRPFGAFERTADLGFHFGSAAQAAKRRAIMISRGEAATDDPWRVETCALSIRNPLVIADDPGVWNPRWVTATLCNHLDVDDRDRITMLARRIDEIVASGGGAADWRGPLDDWFTVLRNALRADGHDGIVYRNVFESVGRATEWSWVAFDDNQLVRFHTDPGVDAIHLPGIAAGAPLRLRGVGPMRHHQERGIGRLSRATEVRAFRAAVEEWARLEGITWDAAYPLDHQPSFGEMRPTHDLAARVGGAEGYHVRVSSRTGEVILQPFSGAERGDALMALFRCGSSEGFLDQGTRRAGWQETVAWRPAETLEAFSGRLAAVHAAFRRDFGPVEATAAPGP